jgi:hypothetical protein
MMRLQPFIAQCVVAAGACLLPSLAHAEWLSGPSREISIADSASPDAPVSSYAYGPRAQASLGGDVALYTLRGPRSTLRLGGDALVVFEDAARRAVLPGETLRTSFEISGAWALTDFATRAFGQGRELELSLAIGRHSALPMTDFTLGDSFHSDDVPFGAGGNYLGLDSAFRAPIGHWFVASSRLGFRLYTNAFPDLFGAHEASDTVADSGHEGAEYQAWFEVGLRLHATEWAEPLARLYLDLIEPHDDSAKTLALARLLLGVALPGKSFELTPFTAFEAGHGEGILVNRTELRWSGGVRLYAR